MNHSFNVDIAKVYGVDGAIIIENIFFWLQKNKANSHNFHDGNYWTYNSIKAFSELFPYWSERQMRRILKNLTENGAIITGNYNANTYDRTIWYSLTETSISILLNGQMEVHKTSNGSSKKVESYNTDGKPNDKPIVNIKDDFKIFWDLYAKKVDPKKCSAKWSKLKAADKEQIFKTLPAYIQSTPDKQYRKNPLTYLNGESWNSEIIINQPQQQFLTPAQRREENNRKAGEAFLDGLDKL